MNEEEEGAEEGAEGSARPRARSNTALNPPPRPHRPGSPPPPAAALGFPVVALRLPLTDDPVSHVARLDAETWHENETDKLAFVNLPGHVCLASQGIK